MHRINQEIFEERKTPTPRRRSFERELPMYKRRRRLTIIAIALVSIALAFSAIWFLVSGVQQEKAGSAIAAVAADVKESPIVVVVDEYPYGISGILTEGNTSLTSTEEATIAEEIRNALTIDALSSAPKKAAANNTYEANVDITDGVSAVISVKDEGNNEYRIVSIVATLTPDAAAQRKEAIGNPFTTDAQKKSYSDPINKKKSSDASDNDIELINDIIISVPEGYNEKDLSSSEIAGENDENIDMRTFKNADDSSSITIRNESMGTSFAAINGLDTVNKMLGYWKDTTLSVAEGAGQKIKDDGEFSTQVFYDPDSGLWGYWGCVVFTDGSRDVAYNRLVLADEKDNSIVTVSYRRDSKGEGDSSLPISKFKNLFAHK